MNLTKDKVSKQRAVTTNIFDSNKCSYGCHSISGANSSYKGHIDFYCLNQVIIRVEKYLWTILYQENSKNIHLPYFNSNRDTSNGFIPDVLGKGKE